MKAIVRTMFLKNLKAIVLTKYLELYFLHVERMLGAQKLFFVVSASQKNLFLKSQRLIVMKSDIGPSTNLHKLEEDT